MSEETKVYDSIEEMEQETLGDLYAELEAYKPGSEQYDKILTEICKIRDKFNEGNKIWISKEDLDQRKETEERKIELEERKLAEQIKMEEQKQKNLKTERILNAVGFGINLLVGTGMTLTTLVYNVKMGPVSTKETWSFAKDLFKFFKKQH